jgi:subtilisin family serine protease
MYRKTINSFILALLLTGCNCLSQYARGQKIEYYNFASENDRVEILLNQVLFNSGDEISVELFKKRIDSELLNPTAILITSDGKDIEYLNLSKLPDGKIYRSSNMVRCNSSSNQIKHLDGFLTLKPNERFFCYYFIKEKLKIGKNNTPDVVFDMGFLRSTMPGNPVVINPKIDSILSINGGQTGIAAREGTIPIKFAKNQLVLYPRDNDQLKLFLLRYKGKIIKEFKYPPSAKTRNKVQTAVLIQVGSLAIDNKDFYFYQTVHNLISGSNIPQKKIYFNGPATVQTACIALEASIEGFVVDLNLLPEAAGEVSTSDPTTVNSASHPSVNLLKVQGLLSLWDKDNVRINLGFPDAGFAPNAEFRSSPVSASSLPLLGMEPRGLHGNGVISTAGGIFNNSVAAFGTGGQVVVPFTYQTDLDALELAPNIARAVNDGVSAISISHSYPCNVSAVFGVQGLGVGICTSIERLPLCLAASTVLRAATSVLCLLANPLCAVLTAVNVVGFVACLTIDVESPMEASVNFALSMGVPVFACAGNKGEIEKFRQVFPWLNSDTDARVEIWRNIPANIPGVICVGNADLGNGAQEVNGARRALSFFENVGFWGPRVDIWAPTPTVNFTPTPDSRSSIPVSTFSGTSAATPYIAGLVANIQAIDPSLNRMNSTLSATQQANIPGEIRRLLRSTAWTSVELRDRFGDINPRGERGLFVNPVRLTEAALDRMIPHFSSLAARGYPTDVNMEQEDTREHNDDLMTGARKLVLSEETATSLNGTILTVKGGSSSVPDSKDVDWIQLIMPGTGDRLCNYTNLRLQLKYPKGCGELRINNDETIPLSIIDSGDETVKTYLLPPLLNGSCYYIGVSGDLYGSDNVYQISVSPAICNVVSADRFDATSPGNDNSANATPITDWMNITDVDFPVTFEKPYKEIVVANLNLHNMEDKDWFMLPNSIPAIPSNFYAAPCNRSVNISISAVDGTLIQLYDDALNRISVYDVSRIKYISVSRNNNGLIKCEQRLIAYSLKITLNAYSEPQNLCEAAGTKFNADLLKDLQDRLSDLVMPIDPCLSCPLQSIDLTENASYKKLYFNWPTNQTFNLVLNNITEGEYLVRVVRITDNIIMKEFSNSGKSNSMKYNIHFTLTNMKKGEYKLELRSVSKQNVTLRMYLPKQISPKSLTSAETYLKTAN